MSKKADKTQSEKKTKHFESKFEPIALREQINAGKDASQIMSELKIGHMQTLRQYVLRLMDLDKSFYEIPGLYKNNTRRPVCNFKNDIVIRKKMLERVGVTYQQGDEFEISIIDGKIQLSLVEKSN